MADVTALEAMVADTASSLGASESVPRVLKGVPARHNNHGNHGGKGNGLPAHYNTTSRRPGEPFSAQGLYEGPEGDETPGPSMGGREEIEEEAAAEEPGPSTSATGSAMLVDQMPVAGPERPPLPTAAKRPKLMPPDEANFDIRRAVQDFWPDRKRRMEQLTVNQLREMGRTQTLPVARVKKIMRMDDGIKGLMISGDAPVLLSQAAEFLIEELTLRAWQVTEESKRKTLNKQDVCIGVCRQEHLDFLIDIVPRVASAHLYAGGFQQEAAVPPRQTADCLPVPPTPQNLGQPRQPVWSLQRTQSMGGVTMVQGAQGIGLLQTVDGHQATQVDPATGNLPPGSFVVMNPTGDHRPSHPATPVVLLHPSANQEHPADDDDHAHVHHPPHPSHHPLPPPTQRQRPLPSTLSPVPPHRMTSTASPRFPVKVVNNIRSYPGSMNYIMENKENTWEGVVKKERRGANEDEGMKKKRAQKSTPPLPSPSTPTPSPLVIQAWSRKEYNIELARWKRSGKDDPDISEKREKKPVSYFTGCAPRVLPRTLRSLMTPRSIDLKEEGDPLTPLPSNPPPRQSMLQVPHQPSAPDPPPFKTLPHPPTIPPMRERSEEALRGLLHRFLKEEPPPE